MKIYTRTGDDGTTGLYRGGRVLKSSTRIVAIGDVDELNAWLGFIRTTAQQSGFEQLCSYFEDLQIWLFNVGAVLAENPAKVDSQGEGASKTHSLLPVELVERIEGWIDCESEQLEPLKYFVLPGGTNLNSQLHIARAVCRRAERSIVDLLKEEGGSEIALRFINRLSDFLFVLARRAASLEESPEYFWIPNS
jgi:cob(I)alamin adenosyltransferase